MIGIQPHEKYKENSNVSSERPSSYFSTKRIHWKRRLYFSGSCNLVPRACDPREATRGSGIIRCRKPGILAKAELHIPFQRPIRFLPETDYLRASRSFPRIAGSGNEIEVAVSQPSPGNEVDCIPMNPQLSYICMTSTTATIWGSLTNQMRLIFPTNQSDAFTLPD